MNQYFYEQRVNEKVKELQAEGLQSQAYYRFLPARDSLFTGLQRLILSHLSARVSKEERFVKNAKPELNYSEP